MTETVPKVYDLTYPSPATLKEISCIVVAVNLWRREISACLEKENSYDFSFTKNILLRNLIPNLPSTIYNFLEECVTTFRQSILEWLHYHEVNVFVRHFDVFNYNNPTNVLSRFHDFAWDWNGSIHYVRTAERMMLCDQLTEDEKFKIACLYCFEDDIRRIWPSVSAKLRDVSPDDFLRFPQTFYWICYLRNELDKLPISAEESIEETMLYESYSDNQCNQSCMQYFWNRLPSDAQSQIDIGKLHHCPELFARFILPALNEHRLELFLVAEGANLMWSLFPRQPAAAHVMPTWMYIRYKIDASNFIRFIQKVLMADQIFYKRYFYSRTVEYLFSEIWKSAPQHLKRSALDYLLFDDRSFDETLKFLITILRDATVEERGEYWHKHWLILIRVMPVKDLPELMKSCFRNENEMVAFKENTMTRYENIAECCCWMLEEGLFERLNGVLSICGLDVPKMRDWKQRMLWSVTFNGNNKFINKVFVLLERANEFINDAFQDATHLGVEFKTHFISTPVVQDRLFTYICHEKFSTFMEFFDTFSPQEQVVAVKKRLYESFKERFINRSVLVLHFINSDMRGFITWLLGSEDEVTKFKQSLSVDDIFQCIMQSEQRAITTQRDDGDVIITSESSARLDDFLIWYFNNNKKAIEKFEELLSVELKTFVSSKRRRIE